MKKPQTTADADINIIKFISKSHGIELSIFFFRLEFFVFFFY